ncbi:heavy metal translocating P-type ATPase [Prevotella nigrescens]|uniref:heavy metal translocating P-type ATPase n=1 Tax=Prevotella nigrescens TaxID=28133 RepID=UPI0002182E2D|nr:HAD-IC family P-type ATPase [Prevotella nigrescens]EGQ17320.1 copper-exporting ATPase [Prevotella nigrescens ATCC 33563]UAK29046.1 HAD-IC family P-type ATPase [Prevotella nigrescens]WMS21825.1 HAD-IC family P-type ATPase [Prevotella nigrescens]SUB92000.1 Copper-exporting P-type ATPase A [Prevotella nigrescens]
MKKTIPVIGMACSACSANIEKKLNSLNGITSASVSLPSRSALVDFNPDEVSLTDMKAAINAIGYDLVIEEGRSAVEIEKRAYTLLKRKAILSWIFAIGVMAISMHWINLGNNNTSNQVALLVALGNMLYCGKQFYVSAWKQLKNGLANMDTLVALSTLIAFLFSVFNTFWGEAVWSSRGIVWHTYYDASVMIITFVLTGKLLEEKAKDGTASSIREMMGMTPKTAHIVDGDKVEEVPISTIEVGDLLEVRTGEKVPVDGEVVWAESFMTPDAAYIDESMITGEPNPAKKEKGDRVLAGTIPNQGKLRMRARQIGKDTMLAQIIRMVQEAQGSKAPVQRIVDKAALVFVPVVSTIALVTFLAWWIIGGNTYLPQAILSAIAVLVIACPCAMGLATPTALMVGIGKAAEEQILIKDASALENLRKINALVTDKTGTLTIPNKNIDFTKSDNLALEERETLKPNAREAMETLQKNGVEVYMMSGDKEEAAKYWAEKAGIKHYQSKVLPQDKESLVRRLQAEGKHVAMVGDGINDTQALALADVSIAIGKGTDVAMDVAQITLMGDDLRTLPEALQLSRRTVRMIWENLFWAFIYNIVCIPLAAGVLYLFGIDWQITPSWASALMAFSSVSVVLNSLRLKLMK